jgi:hypothetical protein
MNFESQIKMEEGNELFDILVAVSAVFPADLLSFYFFYLTGPLKLKQVLICGPPPPPSIHCKK